MRRWGLVIVGAFALGGLRVSDAAACSCLGPQLEIIGPDRVDDAPLNTRVRFEAPASGAPVSTKNAVLRVSETSARAEVTERTWKDGTTLFVELTPVKPLAANTRYEVAFIDPDPNAYPSTSVLSTFKTGIAADTTAPKLDAVGPALARGDSRAQSSMCGIAGPWIEISGIVATDPGRPNAKLRFAIWAGDAAGNVDTSKLPNALYARWDAVLTIGKRSLCDPHDFPIPANAPSMTIAIAAVDEAGNTSTARKLPKIALAGVGAHP